MHPEIIYSSASPYMHPEIIYSSASPILGLTPKRTHFCNAKRCTYDPGGHRCTYGIHINNDLISSEKGTRTTFSSQEKVGFAKNN